MDKLVQTQQKPVISNDGASIMKLLDIVHPAAKTLVDIAQAQDAEVGDGTTTVVLLAAEILKTAKDFVNEGMHPQVIIRGIRMALRKAIESLNSMAVTISETNPEEKRAMLEKVAGTALNSKLIRSHREYFAKMIVDAVSMLDADLDLGLIGIKKVAGGSVTDSTLIHGVAFEKTFSYAGFEQQPKQFTSPRILLLNLELELKSERDNAEVPPFPRFDIDPDQSFGVSEHCGHGVASDLRETGRLHRCGRQYRALSPPDRRPGHAVLRGPRRVLRGPRFGRRHEATGARHGRQDPVDGVRTDVVGAGELRGVRGSAGGEQAVQSVHGLRGVDVGDVPAARRCGAVLGGSGAIDPRCVFDRKKLRDRLADGDQEVHSQQSRRGRRRRGGDGGLRGAAARIEDDRREIAARRGRRGA